MFFQTFVSFNEELKDKGLHLRIRTTIVSFNEELKDFFE